MFIKSLLQFSITIHGLFMEGRGDFGALPIPFAFLMRSVLRRRVAFQYADAWPNHWTAQIWEHELDRRGNLRVGYQMQSDSFRNHVDLSPKSGLIHVLPHFAIQIAVSTLSNGFEAESFQDRAGRVATRFH